MAEYPAIPLWTDAYIADTTHLTNEEHGVYLRLLMFAWRSENCALPDNDKRLALMVGLSPKKWQTLRATIEQFFTVENGTWTQKRLTREREFVTRQSEKNRAAAEARWKPKPRKENNVANADATPGDMPDGCVTDAPTPTPTVKKERDKSLSKEMDGFHEFWAVVPRKVAKGAAAKAYRSALRQADARTILDGMIRYAESRVGQDAQYTVHPATWLNSGRWTDENISQAGRAVPVQIGTRKVNAKGETVEWEGDNRGWVRVYQ